MDSRAVVAVDIAAHGAIELRSIEEALAMDRLRLERMEEGFDVRVVRHGLGPVHALYDAAARQLVAIEVSAVFASTVRMEHQTRLWLSLCNGPTQRGDREVTRSLHAKPVAEQ